jgi:hypothetical protein
MEKSNQKSCQCEKASCVCAESKTERCNCGDECNCARACNCAAGCNCSDAT